MTISPTDIRRIELTVSCRDVDTLPKVDGAGEVRAHQGTQVQVMHNGVLVEADGYCGAWMTELIRRLHGHHEPQEESTFNAMVERLRAAPGAPVMVELGSYWAYYSLWLLDARPDTRCVLIEPDPSHLAVGQRNFALNEREGRFLQAAIGMPHGSVAPLVCESDGVERDIERVTVDGLAEREGLDRIDLLLCDVQGAELQALEGAEPLLERGALRFVLVSTHHPFISGDPLIHQRCLAWLQERGAHIIAEHSITESCSGDGLIAASFDPADADLTVLVSHVRARDSLFGEWEPLLAEAMAERDALRATPPPPPPEPEPTPPPVRRGRRRWRLGD